MSLENSNHFEVIDLAASSQALIDEARATLDAAPSQTLRALAARLPDSIESSACALNVVFCGQYSAGKSSVISALTGRDDVPIDGKITTQTVTPYRWSGVTITDTPGIHTNIRPDHDALTYQAIAEADLVVFVVTNELFDDHLAQHFRDLAVERDKAHEMLLLVNKMGRHSLGNSVEARETVKEDLRKVLRPFTPEDVCLTFTDAKSLIDARASTSEHAVQLRVRRSGIEEFAENLNEFVREKGLAARYTTGLYTLEQVLQEALGQERSGDLDADALEEVLVQKRRALIEEKQKLPDALRPVVARGVESVRSDGRTVSAKLHGDLDSSEVKNDLEVAQNRVEKVVEKLSDQLEQIIGQRIEVLESRIEGIMDSELARELLPRLSARVAQATDLESIDPNIAQSVKSGAGVSQRLGNFLIKRSFSPKNQSLSAVLQLKSYSGTDTHKAVLAVGRTIGKKFKPWEAVKWTKRIANAGHVLAVAGLGITLYLNWREEQAEATREKELAEARAAIRGGFSDAAHAIESHFDSVTDTYIAQVFTPEIESVDRDLAELREMQTQRSEQYEQLRALLERTRAQIRLTHAQRFDAMVRASAS